MTNEHESDIDVVEMARRRIRNVFNTAGKVAMSISGGKDSICLNDLVWKAVQSGDADPSKLEVFFIDEEAIYPCIEKAAMNIRAQWISIGVPFTWYCLQVKHYNCLNSLQNDESFICWDETKKDAWIRKMPKFAVTSDPFLDERHDTYQSFFDKKLRNHVRLTGVRMYESIQRRAYMARSKDQSKVWPIYDWKDTDVWRYMLENDLEVPDAYFYMYQCGLPKNRMRISQFFSIDTVGSLVEMCKFYPNLFDRICKREPNAYLAMLYFDTEMFRRKKTASKKDDTDYQKKLAEVLKEKWRFQGSRAMEYAYKDCTRILLKYGPFLIPKDYKALYNLAVGGDPKHRTARAIELGIEIREFKQEAR